MSKYPSTEEIIEQHRYLWDGTDSGWVLARINPDDDSVVTIEHELTKMGLVIEDNEAYREIIRRMRAVGVRIID